MKTATMSLAALGLTLLLAGEASAQYHSLAIDTCAPHRAGYYGYARPGGGHLPLMHRRMAGSVRPFQGMINPRYAPRYYLAVVEEPAPYYTTRAYNHLPREVLERREELEVASDEELLEGPPAPPPPPAPADRYQKVSHRGAPPTSPAQQGSPAPRREQVSQGEAFATAKAVTSVRPGRVMAEVETMSAEAARSYAARASATMSRLKGRARPSDVPQVAVRP